MEGAAKWLATGPENQGYRKARGSIPPPSARTVNAHGCAARLLSDAHPPGVWFKSSAVRHFAAVAQWQCSALVSRRSRFKSARWLRVGKGGSFRQRDCKSRLF
jgi:hypothetical protein